MPSEEKPFGEPPEEIRSALRSDNLKLDSMPKGPPWPIPANTPAGFQETAVQCRIGTQGGKVIVDFGRQISWMSFSETQARNLAKRLMLQADQLGRDPT